MVKVEAIDIKIMLQTHYLSDFATSLQRSGKLEISLLYFDEETFTWGTYQIRIPQHITNIQLKICVEFTEQSTKNVFEISFMLASCHGVFYLSIYVSLSLSLSLSQTHTHTHTHTRMQYIYIYINLDGFRSRLRASYVSSHTKEF